MGASLTPESGLITSWKDHQRRLVVLGKAYILLATLVAFVLKSGMEAISQNAQMP